MTATIRHLPLVQNWDCHQTGTCCKEYHVGITEAEKKQIDAQGWDIQADLGGLGPVKKVGLPWNRHYELGHRPDGSCVFLGETGRCRIHERHGYAAKPLACRLFPFVLVPVADHWRVSLRYACPSAAGNKGRAISTYDADLRQFADQLAEREQVSAGPDGMLIRPPRLQGSQTLDWPDVLRVVGVLLDLLRNVRDPMELRLRKCLTLATEMRRARLDDIRGDRLSEFLVLMRGVADSETVVNPQTIPAPGWVGRVLFRQAASLFLRKDHGPNSGIARQGRLPLLAAAWRFARGTGKVPRLHASLPETTFADLETPRGPLDAEAEALLERYYTIKVQSLQFCGSAQFGMPLWDGLELLVLTLPILLWVSRMFRPAKSAREALIQALVIVDDHYGFNPMLATSRQRLSFRILASSGELARLVAWYSRV